MFWQAEDDYAIIEITGYIRAASYGRGATRNPEDYIQMQLNKDLIKKVKRAGVDSA